MNTKDRSTLAILAQVVCNEQEDKIVRIAAYAAMKGVIHFDPREQFKMAFRGLDFSQDVDWDMVKSYLPEGSDPVMDSPMQISKMRAEKDAVRKTINRFIDKQEQESGMQCSPTDLTEGSDLFTDSQCRERPL